MPDTETTEHEVEGREVTANPSLNSALSGWEYVNPTRTFKRKINRRRIVKTEREAKGMIRFKGGNPTFRKGDLHDELTWSLDQDGLCRATAQGRIGGSGGSGPHSASSHHQTNNRVPSEGLPLPSPASVGHHDPTTPGQVHSVKSEAGGGPPTPAYNGPTTPAYTPGESGAGSNLNPATPSTPGGPKSQGPPSSVPSPFRAAVNPPLPGGSTERRPGVENMSVSPTTGGGRAGIGTSPGKSGPTKRPALPAKDYETVTDSLSLTSAYDYSAMTAWLSHPVKKSRPNESLKPNPLRPLYRRKSQSDLFTPPDLDPKSSVAP